MKYRTIILGLFGAAGIAALAAQAQVPGVNSTLNTVFTLAYDNSTSKPTYSSSLAFAPPTTAHDLCFLKGSSTKTIRVRRVILSGIANLAQTDPVSIKKLSSAPTGGTGTTPTPIPYNSSNSAATAVAEFYTVQPTNAPTSVGILVEAMLPWGASTTLSRPLEFKFGELAAPVFLRGTSQFVSVNLSGLTFVSATLTCTFEWTEDNDS